MSRVLSGATGVPGSSRVSGMRSIVLRARGLRRSGWMLAEACLHVLIGGPRPQGADRSLVTGHWALGILHLRERSGVRLERSVLWERVEVGAGSATGRSTR